MRHPEYLSPSSLDCFEETPDEYYMRYLSDTKVPKIPQTQPMSVGSAFDAHIKSHIHLKLFGPNHKDAPKFELTTLFEAQVEMHNRDWAWENGKYVFEQYLQSGALADLMIELQQAAEDPRFEFDVKGEVEGYREGVTKAMKGLILMGKPDIRFVNSSGAHCIFDWKVNGYCGNSNTSPKPGYVQCREQSGDYWMRKGAHKNAFVQTIRGMQINSTCYLEDVDPKWATQNATYGWLLGEAVGAEIIAGIDQIVCNGGRRNAFDRPALRVASHRTRVSERFQFDVLARYQNLWGIINSEPFYFFRSLSFEESKAKCEVLDKMAASLASNGDSDADWAMKIARG